MTRCPRLVRFVPCLLLAALVFALLPPAAPAQQPSNVKTYMVPMSDGARLATDVREGKGEGPWPVILLRTPYGKKSTMGGLEDYAIVTQDCRGRFDSEGRARPFFDDGWGEHQDGLDTVKWLLAQPWCSGKIGTAGASALGITQNMLAGANPPGVSAQSIIVASGSMYHHGVYPGGCFEENLMAGWLKETKWPDDNLKLMLEHPFYDALWETVNADARIRELRVNIPAIHIGGWFDIFTQGTLDSFMTRSRIRPNQWLIMGPWPHGIKREVGELTFPANAIEIPKPATDASLWFDYWLRGKDTGLQSLPRVHYYLMGACGEQGAPGNEWRSAESWPIPARSTPFYLAPERTLMEGTPPAAGELTYEYNPKNPVPTRGGGNLLLPAGPMDQREVENRNDVLTFTTLPLVGPLEVVGRVTVRLYASSSARDTMFTAKLCDVYPGGAGAAPEMRQSRIQGAVPEMQQRGIQEGRSMLLCDGALRAACRESFSKPSPLEPGRMYEFVVDLGSTAIIFNRGHRIRVDISSSNYPHFAVHPNVWGAGAPRAARQTVYYGGDHPSAVMLRVVPRK